MRCYKHPDRDAIAVCVGCGRGICEDCAMKVGEKFYCKECAEKILERPPQYVSRTRSEEESPRSGAIAVAATLFFIIGIIDVIGSLLMITAGGLISSIPIFGLFSAIPLALGFILIMIGIFNIVAGYWLWHSLRKGGVLGMILAILGILVSTALLFVFGPVAAVDIIIYIVLVILIAAGWSTLR